MDGKRRESGAALFLVLVAILGLAAAGFWNYQRNLESEQRAAAVRPLHGYSTNDLEALADAYRQEIAVHAAKYEMQKTQRPEARDRRFLDEQVREFETVQKHSGRVREAGAELSVREADLARVEEEVRARSGAETELERHLRLLFTF